MKYANQRGMGCSGRCYIGVGFSEANRMKQGRECCHTKHRVPVLRESVVWTGTHKTHADIPGMYASLLF